MDEDSGVKAPVTRLRRRLSVEKSEESKSPAVNTPTKKRGGRRTAKPELGLIDENTPDNTTRRTTKKTATKDVVVPDEKPVTPARRSTRVRSNTSILTETPLVVDSPRARRATRRASLAGSDSDVPLTPIRQTRRTRKDSASSVENEPQLPHKQGIQITEVIIEEPEIKSTPQSETTTDLNNTTDSIRKSPRLLDKKKSTPVKMSAEERSNDTPLTETSKNTPIKTDTPKNTNDSKNGIDTPASNNETKTSQNRLSIASAKLINELNTVVTNKPNFNKSWSDTENKAMNSKRHRTKSWTTLSASKDSKFYSDSESAESKIKQNIKSFSPVLLRYKCGSGDRSLNTSLNHDISFKSTSKRKKKDSMNFVVEDIDNIEKGQQNETQSLGQISTANDESKIAKLLENKPCGDIKTTIFFEDTDSNSEKIDSQTRDETGDQCVPMINHLEINSFISITDKNEPNVLNKSTELSQRKNSEPMDIDETIPESILIQSPEQITTSRKSTSIQISNLSSGETEINKTERKSSIIQSFDKSGIETKTTLILSQIKDSTAGDEVKSPHAIKNKLLSKSVDDLNTTQETETKKNISLHYSTSTPLQDKNIQKFKEILVNTPINATQNNDKKNMTEEEPDVFKDQYNNISQTENKDLSEDVNLKEPKNKRKGKKSYNSKEIEIAHTEDKELEEKTDADKVTLNENHSTIKDAVLVTVKQKNESNLEDELPNIKFNKSHSEFKQSKKNLSNSEESEENESSDDSKNKNNFIDDEAFDAGDDYESGDSQNESEQRYEKENEVLDKGETLTTDEEFSDDSDYEKDSFIVSSNEEDDLLDSTDDDLSMSDNELKMTAKSKKKYNERKGKEQKEASREMFESRHKLNTAKKSTDVDITKAKKNKRQQISSSESEEDIKPRKNNRLRLDSTKEASLIADKSEHVISMKRNKQLLDSDNSSCESANEVEMTIRNESIKESDPLSAEIKPEPKTPQKSADSTIAFIDSENVNNDQIDKNESTKTQSEFLDPLQATMVADDDEDSLSSDDENIIQNYDSVLKDLNEVTKIKAKVCDISLNLDNNRKKKEKTIIVDELNLTQVKSDRKPENKEKTVVCRDKDESSSDSIDFNLLFSEYSNNSNSDNSSLQNKKKAPNTKSEEFIPLKRTEAKTDIRECKDEGASFFFDTVGSHADSMNKSNDLDPKDKKHSTENIDSQEVPMESKPGQKKKRNKSASNSVEDITPSIPDNIEDVPIESNSSEKKKRKKSASNSVEDITPSVPDNIEGVPIESNSSEKKKRNKSASNSVEDITPSIPDNIEDVPIESNSSEKKKRKKSASNSVEDITPSIPDNIEDVPIESNSSEKKKRKKSASNLVEDITPSIPDNIEDVPVESKSSEKKKRKKSASNSLADDVPPSESDNQEVAIEMYTSQQKKHNKSASASIALGDVPPSVTDIQEVPTESRTSQKKKLKKSPSNSVDVIAPSISVENTENAKTSSKKRKRKPSLNTTKEEILPAAMEDMEASKELNESPVGSKKKKRKIATQEELAIVAEAVPIVEEQSSHKKRDKKQQAMNDLQNSSKDIDKRNKKRKEREDDKTSTSKVVKEVAFDKVPRLPTSLLEKLDDVPHVERSSKKPKLASTTPFLVDDIKKKKVKPSDYLEESIYINEESERRRSNKDRLLKPKVLPFVPTASTSSSGFTTNFKITVLPSNITFVAQADPNNFRESHLYGHKIRRPGTFDTYRRQRNRNLTKF